MSTNLSSNEPLTPTAPQSTDFDTDVLIVGAGPTGLTVAAALASAGIRTTVIDRLAEGTNTSRAAVVHARTLEVLEPLGVSGTLEGLGIQAQRFTIRDRDRVLVPIEFDRLPSRYPYTLMVSQAVTESVLLQRYTALGGRVMRPRTLVALRQDEGSATATLDNGERLRARYVVGADGMHSAVRDRAGIAFTGGNYGESFVLADVRLSGGVPHDEVVLYFSPAGMVVVAPLPGGLHRIVATVDEAPSEPDVAFVQALLDARGPEREQAARRGHDVEFALPCPAPCRRRLPGRPRAARRRCGPRPQPRGRPGHERRHPRRDDVGDRADPRAGRQRIGARRLRRGAPSDRAAGRRAGRPADPARDGAAGIPCAAQPGAADAVARCRRFVAIWRGGCRGWSIADLGPARSVSHFLRHERAHAGTALQHHRRRRNVTPGPLR